MYTINMSKQAGVVSSSPLHPTMDLMLIYTRMWEIYREEGSLSIDCLMSLPTQYRLSGTVLQVKRPNQQYQSTEGISAKDKEKNENN